MMSINTNNSLLIRTILFIVVINTMIASVKMESINVAEIVGRRLFSKDHPSLLIAQWQSTSTATTGNHRYLRANASTATTSSSSSGSSSEDEFIQFMESLQRQPEERSLQASCQCILGDNFYSGGCKGLFIRNEPQWCNADEDAGYCCADAESDCCRVSPIRVTFLVLGLLLAITLIAIYWRLKMLKKAVLQSKQKEQSDASGLGPHPSEQIPRN